MKEIDTKKALAFIKSNATDVPARTSGGFVIPEDIVKEIKTQIEKYDGSFAISKEALNKLFDWSEKNARNLYLQKKLNLQYPIEDYEWHVGLINKGELYKFEIRELKEQEDGEGQEPEIGE